VWLAAALAVRTLPEPCWIFDTNLGWMPVPAVEPRENEDFKVQVERLPSTGAARAEISLTDLLDDPNGRLRFPQLPSAEGIVLSGKLPRWFYAAVSRSLAGVAAWVAVRDGREPRAIVVSSRSRDRRIGDLVLLERPPGLE
jgi:hypothetical protein